VENNKDEGPIFDKYKNYVDKLANEYKTTFEKVGIYINGTSRLNTSEKNGCIFEIIDTFLAGQEEGKPLKEITGVDLKKYCDSMIYGEGIYIYKASRGCSVFLGALFYVAYMHFFVSLIMIRLN